jgi:hypothetical protein
MTVNEKANPWHIYNIVADKSRAPVMLKGTWRNGATSENACYHRKPVRNVLEFSAYNSRDEAVRALVLLFHPELNESSIQHLKRVSKNFLNGSMKMFKIMKNSVSNISSH